MTLVATISILLSAQGGLELRKSGDQVAVRRAGSEKPLLVQVAKEDLRPYIHPIVAPDGKGELTELSPGHHKHQTGLYVGILKTNGRDYFHNRFGDHYRRRSVTVDDEADSWTVAYDWLAKDGSTVLVETQSWNLTDGGDHYFLDLDWSARAEVDVTFKSHPYGGLFLRMPFKGKGTAVNSEGLENRKAEGKRSRWVDVGMPIEGRDDWGRIAILDHPENPGHPVTWRVDGQLGVGPARSRMGDWSLDKGKTTRARYRLVIYTGDADSERVEAAWKQLR